MVKTNHSKDKYSLALPIWKKSFTIYRTNSKPLKKHPIRILSIPLNSLSFCAKSFLDNELYQRFRFHFLPSHSLVLQQASTLYLNCLTLLLTYLRWKTQCFFFFLQKRIQKSCGGHNLYSALAWPDCQSTGNQNWISEAGLRNSWKHHGSHAA